MDDNVDNRAPFVRMRGALRLLRPTQWIKNGFVLAPVVFAGRFLDPVAIRQAMLATVLFCIAASAAYIVNDLFDTTRDRQHPIKARTRPLASGAVSVPTAWVLLAVLYGLLVWGGLAVPKVLGIIAAYLALNLAYSLSLKHVPVVDIFTIAICFVLRLYAGAIAVAVPVSSWMFVTTLCLALYLAAIKRRQELQQRGAGSREVLNQYSVSLVNRYAEMSAMGALLFYSVFVMSARPELVITIPLVLFGLFRYWFVVEQLDAGESPTDALTSDPPLLLVIVLWVGLCMWLLWPAP